MNLKKYFCGNETERMPSIAFSTMSFFFKIRDLFCSFEERIDGFGIKEGYTVVDYGCGPGRVSTHKNSFPMFKATFRFYEELNDYLPEKIRKKEFTYPLEKPTLVKKLIESIGAPSEEVDLILVNGTSVDFSYLVKDKDRVSVYPIFETFDISGITMVRDKPLRL